MASTITLAGDWLTSLGNKRMTFGTGNLGVYASDGVSVTPGQLGLGVIESLKVAPAGGLVFEYVPSTGKVKAYQSDDAVDPFDEVGNETDITTTVFSFVAIGT